MPAPSLADEHGICGVGADLAPGTLLAAYRSGLFPMHLHGGGPLGWWSPDPRGILRLDDLRVSRSLRRSVGRYQIRVDTDFDGVIAGCADANREGRWIDDEITAAYRTMFDLGWVHTVETWLDEELVGGLYGVSVGGLFAGESMFHRASDASKVALIALVEILRGDGADRLLDVQWRTDHLATLGVTEVPRAQYLGLLRAALELDPPAAFA